jgi:hypothetical protein
MGVDEATELLIQVFMVDALSKCCFNDFSDIKVRLRSYDFIYLSHDLLVRSMEKCHYYFEWVAYSL